MDLLGTLMETSRNSCLQFPDLCAVPHTLQTCSSPELQSLPLLLRRLLCSSWLRFLATTVWKVFQGKAPRWTCCSRVGFLSPGSQSYAAWCPTSENNCHIYLSFIVVYGRKTSLKLVALNDKSQKFLFFPFLFLNLIIYNYDCY